MSDSFSAKSTLEVAGREYEVFRLDALQEKFDVARLPYSLKVLLENALRLEDGDSVTAKDVETIASWDANAEPSEEIPFTPARVLMQDFTGVPAIVDLAAMRDAMDELSGDPAKINPLVPVELVIDHSIQVDVFAERLAFQRNAELEFERNRERYAFLRWGQTAFDNFSVVPPNTGICHQVNLEYLARVVATRDGVAFPDTLVGTDSHTTMVNGLGVLGWGVGGIEAEAAMLGQPLVLSLTQMLRAHGVVGTFVEFFGDGLSSLSVADRATLSNMCPEYGATSAYFPVDEQTLAYLSFTGRDALVDRVERYAKEQGLFRRDGDPDPTFSEVLELDLSAVVPSVAGPKRPQDRVALPDVWDSFLAAFEDNGEPDPKAVEVGRFVAEGGPVRQEVLPGETGEALEEAVAHAHDDDVVRHGSVVIAAITSCTNTSNPSVMLAAGLLAKRAIEAGLETRPW